MPTFPELGAKRLASLPPQAFLRHLRAIVSRGRTSAPDPVTISSYLARTLAACISRADVPIDVAKAAIQLRDAPSSIALDDLAYAIAYHTGVDVADWDFVESEAAGTRVQHALVAYLDRVRSPFNVGSIIRSAEAFGFAAVVLGTGCPPADHKRLIRSAMGAVNLIRVVAGTVETAADLAGGPLVALETTGSDVWEATLPERGVLVVGSEERGMEPGLLKRCRNSGGVVSIPLYGAKRSVNVGVAFGIAAAAWSRTAEVGHGFSSSV